MFSTICGNSNHPKSMTNTTKTFAIASLVVLLSVSILGCKTQKDDSSGIKLKSFQTEKGWGYSISIQNKQCIYQPFIPILEAQKGFSSKESAEKIGQLVVDRLKNNQSPAITSADLKQAGLIK
jgi:hypothetical protein